MNMYNNDETPKAIQVPCQDPPIGTWTTGLFGCFEDFASSCGIAALIFYGLTFIGCGCLYSCIYRSKLRTSYSLPEEPCMDLFCTPCAICQEYRELKNRGFDPSIGWAANEKRMTKVSQVAPNVPPNIAPGMIR